MQHIGLIWLAVLAPLALQASACGSTENKKHDSGSGGSAGTTSQAGNASGGSKSRGGDGPSAGATSNGGDAPSPDENGGFGGETGGSGAQAGAGDGGTETRACGAPTSLPIVGDYAEPNGDELWLRDSGKAVTLTRLPAGKPSSAKPPVLWQVVQACSADSVLLLQDAAGNFTRLDYLKGAASLTVCVASESTSTLEKAWALPAADRSNTIDSGCGDAAWTRFAKEGT